MARYTIIGAGPVGALMARMLALRGHRVRVLERRADPRLASAAGGRSINLALAARGMAALEHAGVWQRLAAHMTVMPGRMLHHADGELQFLRYGRDAREVIYAIGRERLNRLLIEAAAECPGIELVFQTRLLDLDPDTALMQLHDEAGGGTRTEPFEILLGADGAGSAVRGALSLRQRSRVAEEPLEHDYKELLIAAAPGGSASSPYAFEPHALHIWPRGGFMLIALPNTDGSFTATLFLPRHGEQGFDRLDGAVAVQDFFRCQFADAAAAIADLPQQFALHPQSRLGTLYCQGWQAAGRVLLLGDAAHAIVPFHGQGLNCGFEDCRVLDQLLHGWPDTAAALAEFERRRHPDTDAIAAMALENYLEMRDTVRTAAFAQRQALAAELERHFPGRFIPRYSMVTFHAEIPYAEARRRGAQQARILDALAPQVGATGLGAAALLQAGRLLDAAQL
jgi:kynurenine 3-monooxygenase